MGPALVALFAWSSFLALDGPDFAQVPGVVIDHSPAASRSYCGSPSLVICRNGEYVASHDFFGPGSTRDTTVVFASTDRGRTWTRRATIQGQWWSTLFEHGGLYLMGTSREYGACVIRRSLDGGRTWTEPRDERSGLLLGDGKYHCAPQPVLRHGGYLYRGMEDAMGPGGWGTHFRAFMMSAPEDSDLLRAESWTSTNRLGRDPAWLDGQFGGWLEGNAVLTPEGKVVDLLRVDHKPGGDLAAWVEVGPDRATARFDPATGFVRFPGGSKKFTIRFDPISRHYWSLANIVPERFRAPGRNSASVRNTLALVRSPNLKDWETRALLLQHDDVQAHGFQYADWQFDGDDLAVVVRTAFDDGLGGAHNAHDANFITFHRVAKFRDLTTDAPGTSR